MKHKYAYKWTLKDANFTKDKGKVFSCFACGGGSTMGYKLAGFDVVGCNEIDPRMNSIYINNHHPKHNYLCDIRQLVKMDLPEELYNLDILDGSPPCSTFTIAIARTRQETWGKKKRFREGQAEQVLDTLFFDFIDVVRKLRPKVVIAENVKGLLQGAAKKYVQRIHMEFEDAGYSCHHFLLDAQYMGVPQHRERVFFVCLRNDLIQYVPTAHTLFDTYPVINLNFNEKPITCEEAHLTLGDQITTHCFINEYKRLKNGEETKYQQCTLVDKDMVHPTILAGYRQKASPMPSWGMNWLSNESVCKVSSFPTDYDFGNQKPYYVCGMSVPPVMMAQVASRIYEQWLSKL